MPRGATKGKSRRSYIRRKPKTTKRQSSKGRKDTSGIGSGWIKRKSGKYKGKVAVGLIKHTRKRSKKRR
jgi:hypothetical protein